MEVLLKQEANATKVSSTKLSATGKILITLTGGVAVVVSVVCASFVSPALRKFCLPYIPATDTQLKNVLDALKSTSKGGTLIDLGSGDGRIVFETAKKNFISHGVELNPWLVFYSKLASYKDGLNKRTEFYRRDLWKFDISEYDNVVIFGVEQMMQELEKKIKTECKPNSKIIACRFPLPNMTPVKTIGSGVDTVWVYEINS